MSEASIMIKTDKHSIAIQIRKGSVDEINNALKDVQKFKSFTQNPKKFLAGHGVTIDDDLSEMFKTKLTNAKSFEEAQKELKKPDGGGAPCNVWAVSSASFQVASTKWAVIV